MDIISFQNNSYRPVMNLANKLLLKSNVNMTLLLIDAIILLPIVLPKKIIAIKNPTHTINNPLTSPANKPSSLLNPLIIGILAIISAEKRINQIKIHSIRKQPINDMALMIILARYPATYSSNNVTISS